MPSDHVDLPSQLPLIFEQQEQALGSATPRSHLTLVVSNEHITGGQSHVQTYLQVFEAAVERVKLF